MAIDDIVNVKMLLHPLNWLIVGVAIAIFGMGFAMVKGHFGPAASPYAPVAD